MNCLAIPLRLHLASARLVLCAITLMLTGQCLATDVVHDPTKKKGAGTLFRIHYGGKWGFMAPDGRVAIPPRFEDEGDLLEGLARVQQDSKWGYIDETGHVKIPFKFAEAGDFREGLAPVELDRKWGFINQQGQIEISPQFQAAAGFNDGLALIEVWTTAHCGKESFTRENAPAYAFRLHAFEPIIPGYCYPDDNRYGFVDKDGKVAIAPTLVEASSFSEGLALMKPTRSLGFGFINRAGKTVVDPQFDRAYPFSEGFAAVAIGTGSSERWGFIDRTGGYLVAPRFDEAHSFSGGFAEVKLGDWGYINTRGKLAIPLKYAYVSPFSDGLALVSPAAADDDDEWYIDKTGRRLWF